MPAGRKTVKALMAHSLAPGFCLMVISSSFLRKVLNVANLYKCALLAWHKQHMRPEGLFGNLLRDLLTHAWQPKLPGIFCITGPLRCLL